MATKAGLSYAKAIKESGKGKKAVKARVAACAAYDKDKLTEAKAKVEKHEADQAKLKAAKQAKLDAAAKAAEAAKVVPEVKVE